MKLNLGCGSKLLKGYINIDSEYPQFDTSGYDHRQWNALDIDKYFLAESVEEVFSSHFFEHLIHHEVTELLFKIYHILEPNGKLIIIVPDFHQLILQAVLDANAGKFDNVDLLNLKMFSTVNESLHKSVWFPKLAEWYLIREGLYKDVTVERVSQFEIKIVAIKK